MVIPVVYYVPVEVCTVESQIAMGTVVPVGTFRLTIIALSDLQCAFNGMFEIARSKGNADDLVIRDRHQIGDIETPFHRAQLLAAYFVGVLDIATTVRCCHGVSELARLIR